MYNNGIGVHNCAPGYEAGVKCDGMSVCMIFLTMLKLQRKCVIYIVAFRCILGSHYQNTNASVFHCCHLTILLVFVLFVV